MAAMSRSLVLCALLLAAGIQISLAQKCFSFQAFSSPRSYFPPNDNPMCAAYMAFDSNPNGKACCSASQAKRAYNWVMEDDGCGVVGGACAQYLTDFACALSCSSNLTVTGSTVNNASNYAGKPTNRMVVCPAWAKTAFQACYMYSWCLPQNGAQNDCKYAAKAQPVSYRSSTSALSTATAPDTCTFMYDYQRLYGGGVNAPYAPNDVAARAFVENVLGAIYGVDGDCTTPSWNMPVFRSSAPVISSWSAMVSVVMLLVSSMMMLMA